MVKRNAVKKRKFAKIKAKSRKKVVSKVKKSVKKFSNLQVEKARPKYQKDLARLAREAIQKHFEGGTIEVPERIKRKYAESAGIFVTLYHFNEQRGCIGFAEPMFPIWEGVISAALGAAFNDPRCMPLSPEELEECKLEVSVIQKPTQIKNPSEIQIGRHGLIVQKEHRTGLILPEVFMDYQTNTREALEMTCRNAGLPQDSWQKKETTVLKFHTEKVRE